MQNNDTERKAINLLCVDGLMLNSFWGHVDIRTGAHGEAVLKNLWSKLSHSKIGHFGPHIANQQHIIAGEISVDDAIGMEKCEGQSNIMADVDLDMVRNRLTCSLKEVGQALVHQLHQEDWQTSIWILPHAKVLDDVGVP